MLVTIKFDKDKNASYRAVGIVVSELIEMNKDNHRYAYYYWCSPQEERQERTVPRELN